MTTLRQKATTLLQHLAEIAALFATIGFILGTLGRHHWILDLASHFRFQYLAAFAAATIVFAASRRWKSALAAAAATTLVAISLAPYYLPSSATPASPKGTPLKLITFNVNTANDRHAEVTDYLFRENADVVILLEVGPRWIEGLTPLHALYPHRYENPRRDNFGMAFFSKHPFEDRSPEASDRFGRPVVDALVHLPTQSVEIVGTHPDPPTSSLASASRDEMLVALLPTTSDPRDHPFIAAGDFNLSQFSPNFQALLHGSGLQDTAVGHGLAPTWMRRNPVFAAPIDQVLISPDVEILSRHVGPSIGSDHSPLIVELSLPARRAEPFSRPVRARPHELTPPPRKPPTLRE